MARARRRFGFVGAAADDLGRRQTQSRRVTARLLAGRAHPGELRFGLGHPAEGQVEFVGEGGRQARGAGGPAATDDHGRVRPLHRLGQGGAVPSW